MNKVEAANDRGMENADLYGGDLQQFILLKKALLQKPYIELLKEKILGSSQPDVPCSKECDNLPEVSKPCVNPFTYNCYRDDHGIEKFIQTMKYASQQTKKLSLIRKYRKLKNLANTPLKSVGGASQKDYSSLQHLAEQNALDDMQNQQTNVDGTHVGFQMEKAKAIPRNVSAEFHNVETHSQKGDLSGYASPIFSPDDLKESRSEHESQLHNVLHHDRDELEEVADSDCDDVNLLEKCSMPQPSSAQRLCLKCGSTDQLLNCYGEDCLRAIHERCLGPLASVEETGIFYCPLCSYRNARMMFEKSKRKAQEARKSLFAFYDITPAIHALKRKSPAKILIENEQVNVKHNLGELSDCPCKETIECWNYPKVPQTTINLNSVTGREHGSTRVTGDWQPVNDLGITGYDSLSSELNASHETNGDVCVNNGTREVCRDHLQAEEGKNLHTSDADNEQISVRCAKRNRRDKTDRDVTNPGVIEKKRTDGSSSRELRKRQNPLNRCSTIKQPPSRRPKLIWKPEEEEILKEAMQKILQNGEGNIPWIKILEYCRPVLHESRTPIDLKDKWRNMLKKRL